MNETAVTVNKKQYNTFRQVGILASYADKTEYTSSANKILSKKSSKSGYVFGKHSLFGAQQANYSSFDFSKSLNSWNMPLQCPSFVCQSWTKQRDQIPSGITASMTVSRSSAFIRLRLETAPSGLKWYWVDCYLLLFFTHLQLSTSHQSY